MIFLDNFAWRYVWNELKVQIRKMKLVIRILIIKRTIKFIVFEEHVDNAHINGGRSSTVSIEVDIKFLHYKIKNRFFLVKKKVLLPNQSIDFSFLWINS